VETSARLDRLRRDLDAVGEATTAATVDAFWRDATATGTPLIEPLDVDTSLVTFLWRGQARSTSVGWGVPVPLERLAGTDLWFATVALPNDLRTLYFFSHDGAEDIPTGTGPGPTHIDPANAHPFHFPVDPSDPTDEEHWASLLELPRAAAEPWLAPPPPGARGTMVETELTSSALGGPRRVCALLPAGLPTDDLPVLVAFDGYLSRTVLGMPTTVDNLIAAGRIPPLVALFVTSPNDVRNDELVPTPPIADFVADELLPWARRQWRITTDPSNNVITGASRGGLAAAYVALRRPDTFGAVISQSGSMWWPTPQEGRPEWLTREFAARPKAPLRFYLEVGNREDTPGPAGAPSQVAANRRMRHILAARGYPVAYHEYTGAHDYVNWRRTFADGLIAVLGTPGLPRAQGSRNC
jgi:enterochelin esterase-like enzyme